MRRPLLFFIFSLQGLVFFFHTVTAQNIQFNPVPRATDDPGGPIAQMAQDPQGFLWMATQYGLYKYDGYRYISYHNEPLNSNSLAADQIWDMTIGKTGYVWLSPAGAGLDRLDPATGTFTHFRHRPNDPNSLGNDSVSALLEDREGIIWIGTGTKGLDRYDPSTNIFTHYRHSTTDTSTISCDAVRTIYEDREGTLWIGTGSEYYGQNPTNDNDGGLNKFDKKTQGFTRYKHDDKNQHTLIDNRVKTIFEDSRGVFWVGSVGDGLHTMDRKTGLFERHQYNPSNPQQLSRPPVKNSLSYVADYITFILEDSKGNIWIGTFEGGMNIYDPLTKKCTYYGTGKYNSEAAGAVGYWNALRTKDNVVWLSTVENHLYKVVPYQNVLQHTYVGKVVTAFAEDNANKLWLGTYNGLLHKDSSGKEQQIWIDKDPSSLANIILAIEKVDDQFWLATPSGLYRFDPATKMIKGYHSQAGNANSLRCDTVETVKKGAGNTLWLATSNGVDLMDIEKETFTHFLNDKEGQDSSSIIVTAVAIDKKQNALFGTQSGLYIRDATTGVIKRYMENLNVFYTLPDSAGEIWCGTNAGLYRYNKIRDKFSRFRDESAIVNMPLWTGGLTEDKKQQLWFISASGIVKINKDRKGSTLYGRNQGVNSLASTYTGYLTNDGKVLYSDTSGYFTINPDSIGQQTDPPVVMVTNFFINNEPVLLSEKLTLNHDENTFSFAFTNIDFISIHEDTRLLFKLEPFDTDWRTAGDERTARYFNIPPGNYSFKIKALNAAGIAAEKAIVVIVAPPWWKTWWAYSLFIIIAAAIVYAVYRNRIGQLKKKQADQMHIMVATQEGERRRISRDLHDDVGTKLSALKLSLSSLEEKAIQSNNPAIRQLSVNAQQTITEVMQDVRQLLLNLSPVTLEAFGYTVAVEALVNKINETKQIHFDLVLFGMKQPLTKDYELALYRITQELINNVLKHAAAKNVSLQIGQRDEKIILMIEDDGIGFDVHNHTNGLGLHNLDARTKLLNGTMTIDTQPGKGTSILIEIPYNNLS